MHMHMQVKALEERLSDSQARVSKKEASVAELKMESARLKDELVATARGTADDFSNRLESERLRWQSQHDAAHGAHTQAHMRAHTHTHAYAHTHTYICTRRHT